MTSLIFRTTAPIISCVMLVFSVFVLLRGHNDPGGGFIGGLIAASAIAVYAFAAGPRAVRRALKASPTTLAGLGIALATLAGMLSILAGVPYLTGLWHTLGSGDAELAISTPLLFDIGVYLAVFGTVSAITLALQSEEGR